MSFELHNEMFDKAKEILDSLPNDSDEYIFKGKHDKDLLEILFNAGLIEPSKPEQLYFVRKTKVAKETIQLNLEDERKEIFMSELTRGKVKAFKAQFEQRLSDRLSLKPVEPLVFENNSIIEGEYLKVSSDEPNTVIFSNLGRRGKPLKVSFEEAKKMIEAKELLVSLL
jgi:hypothetical protein